MSSAYSFDREILGVDSRGWRPRLVRVYKRDILELLLLVFLGKEVEMILIGEARERT